MPAFNVQPLVHVPAARAVLEGLFIKEWAAWYGLSGPGNAAADLLAATQTKALPMAMVATDPQGRALGCAMLKAESVGAELGYGPFLAGFLVDPEMRRRGVGNALVAAVEAKAARMGYDALYGATDSAGGLLLRRGWQAIDHAASSRGDMVIYRLKLSSHAASAS